jgi:predicted RNA-binding Zn-ribbon protein involved in translation (DUF1610 family)
METKVEPTLNTALALLLRWCPVCLIHQRKVRITRQRASDYGRCPHCGWDWEPNS